MEKTLSSGVQTQCQSECVYNALYRVSVCTLFAPIITLWILSEVYRERYWVVRN